MRFSFLSVELPVYSNKAWRSLHPVEGGGDVRCCFSAAVSLSGPVCSHGEDRKHKTRHTSTESSVGVVLNPGLTDILHPKREKVIL